MTKEDDRLANTLTYFRSLAVSRQHLLIAVEDEHCVRENLVVVVNVQLVGRSQACGTSCSPHKNVLQSEL